MNQCNFYVSSVRNNIAYHSVDEPKKEDRISNTPGSTAHDMIRTRHSKFTVHSTPSSDSRSLRTMSPKPLVHIDSFGVKVTTLGPLETAYRDMGVSS